MLFYTNKTFYNIFTCTEGLSTYNKIMLLKRIELSNSIVINSTFLVDFKDRYKKDLVGFLNKYYSQVNSVNAQLYNLKKLNIIRLYLIKSYRGRCHALGKPVKGQRTWSNGWTSYKYNLTLRKFIGEMKSKISSNTKTEKINYKMTKKKYGVINKLRRNTTEKNFTTLWL